MSEDAFKLIHCPDPGAWDGFIESSPQGCVFARTEFLAALGQPAEYFFVVENGAPVLAVPVLLRDGIPLETPYSYAQYLGPMFAAAVEAEPAHRRVPHKLRIMDFLLAQMSGRWPFISFTLHPAFDDLRSIQWFNYHAPEKGQFSTRLYYTGRLPLEGLASEEALQEQIRLNRRREYRKASSQFAFGESTDIDTLDRLHEMTFGRQGIDRAEEEVRHMRRIAQTALEKKFGHYFIARASNGEVVSVLLFLHDSHTSYYLIGATDPEYRASGVGSWLMLKAIEHALRAGRKFVDFVGVNSPNRGDFKTSFGAQPVPYFNVIWRRP